MSELFTLLTRFVEAVETIAKNSKPGQAVQTNLAATGPATVAETKTERGKTAAEAKAPAAEGKSKTAEAPTELDYAKDVQPACLKLIAKDKAAFVAILRKYDLQKASETAAVPHYAAILADVNTALEAADAAA